MTKYFVPLGVFVGGMLTALVVFLFLGAIGDAATQLQADSAAIAPAFWNFAWVSSPNTVKFLVFIGIILLTLFATARAFLKVR